MQRMKSSSASGGNQATSSSAVRFHAIRECSQQIDSVRRVCVSLYVELNRNRFTSSIAFFSLPERDISCAFDGATGKNPWQNPEQAALAHEMMHTLTGWDSRFARSFFFFVQLLHACHVGSDGAETCFRFFSLLSSISFLPSFSHFDERTAWLEQCKFCTFYDTQWGEGTLRSPNVKSKAGKGGSKSRKATALNGGSQSEKESNSWQQNGWLKTSVSRSNDRWSMIVFSSSAWMCLCVCVACHYI